MEALLLLLLSSHVHAIDILGTQTVPVRPRDSVAPAAIPEHGVDVDYWCKTIDTTNPDEVVDLWEKKQVGLWLGVWTQPTSNTTELGPDGWPLKVFKSIYPNAGDPGLGGCGVIGGGCSPKLDCADMVKNGQGSGGEAYWSLQALSGMQNKLNAAHEFLQDATIDNILMLDQISSDFTAPDNWAGFIELAGLLSSCFYMLGSVAGSVGVGITAGFGAASRVGVAEAKYATISKDILKYGPDALKAADDELTAAKKQAAQNTQMQAVAGKAGALGSAFYLVGSTFGLVSAGSTDDGTGKVESGDLAPVLQTLFDSAREQLSTMGECF